MSWESWVFLLQYRDFLHLKSNFPHLKSNFPCTKSNLPKSAFYFLWRLSTFFNGFPLSSTAFRFLQWLSKFLQRLSDFPQWLSAFREIRENLFMARSIQKIAIRASYLSPLAPRALWLSINNTYVITQHHSLSAILRRKIGEPKEEIKKLNGFEYMYLSDLKVPYF